MLLQGEMIHVKSAKVDLPEILLNSSWFKLVEQVADGDK